MRSLSLVVPVFNSPDLAVRLAGHIPALRKMAADCGFELVECLFVDDGSSPPLAENDSFRVIRLDRNHGKGFAVKTAALAAKGDWVLMSDVDESVPLERFSLLAPHSDAAIVCSSRMNDDNRPFSRRLLSRIFRFVVGDVGIRDTQCGFKLFNMAKMRSVFERQTVDRFAFDVELLYRAKRNGLKVVEVPVDWHGGRRSSLKVWRDAPRMLLDTFRIRLS